MSWGYRRNSSTADKIYSAPKVFQNEDMKVYKCNITDLGYLQITIIKRVSRSTVAIKSSSKSTNFDTSHLKTKKEIARYIQDKLLDKFHFPGLNKN